MLLRQPDRQSEADIDTVALEKEARKRALIRTEKQRERREASLMAVSKRIGIWTYRRNYDPFNGIDHSYIFGVGQYGNGLIIRRADAELDILFFFLKPFSDNRSNTAAVRYRIDDNPVSRETRWRLQPGQKSAVIARRELPGFLEGLIEGKLLHMFAKNTESELTIADSFLLFGLNDALKHLENPKFGDSE